MTVTNKRQYSQRPHSSFKGLVADTATYLTFKQIQTFL